MGAGLVGTLDTAAPEPWQFLPLNEEAHTTPRRRGGLLLALNLRQAADVSVLLPVPTERASTNWLSAHGSWQLSVVLHEIAELATTR